MDDKLMEARAICENMRMAAFENYVSLMEVQGLAGIYADYEHFKREKENLFPWELSAK